MTKIMQIEKFDPFMAQVQELVSHPVDSADIDSVKDKKKKLQKTRTTISKLGKEMRDEANAFNKSVLSKEKEIIALITPEEAKLDEIIETYAKIQERKEREALLPERKEKLALIGDGVEISDDAILDMDGTAFMGYMNKRVADKNEKDRLEIVRKQNEIKAQEDAIKRQREIEDAKEQARIDAENKAEKAKADYIANIEKEKQSLIDKVERERKEYLEQVDRERREVQEKIEREKAEQEAEARRIEEEQKKDVGHDLLITDLEILLQEARDYAFHDFKNDKYAMPKMALCDRLFDLSNSVKEGKYDNK